jgi:hypothetical protein
MECPSRAKRASWLNIEQTKLHRGIFGKGVFEKVLADPALHLITWEKGYERQNWPPPGGISVSLVIERARNHAEDIRW